MQGKRHFQVLNRPGGLQIVVADEISIGTGIEVFVLSRGIDDGVQECESKRATKKNHRRIFLEIFHRDFV